MEDLQTSINYKPLQKSSDWSEIRGDVDLKLFE